MGLSFDFPLSATHEIDSGEKNIIDFFEPLDLAVIIGVGFQIPIQTSHILLEIRYSQSLLKLSKKNTNIEDIGPTSEDKEYWLSL